MHAVENGASERILESGVALPISVPGKPLAFIGNPRRFMYRLKTDLCCRGFSITRFEGRRSAQVGIPTALDRFIENSLGGPVSLVGAVCDRAFLVDSGKNVRGQTEPIVRESLPPFIHRCWRTSEVHDHCVVTD